MPLLRALVPPHFRLRGQPGVSATERRQLKAINSLFHVETQAEEGSLRIMLRYKDLLVRPKVIWYFP
jgi:hypothetical protein